jgi:hypothetical protein
MNLTRLSGALLAVALPFAVTGVASASTDTSSLSLTISTPAGDAKTVELECAPAGGGHPHARAACAALFRANGDFEALAAQQELTNCTMEYMPVLAVADGTWWGAPVAWESEFSNRCTLRSATGAVFEF